MKTLILYKSQCGSTLQYVNAIARDFSATVLPINKFKGSKTKDFDTIIFGGWVQNGQIQGLNNFLSEWDYMKDKNVIVFSTGISIPSKEGRELLINENLLNLYHLRYYQLRGSFDISKMKFPYKFIMNYMMKSIARNPKATAEQRSFLMLKDHPVSFYDQEGLDKIIDVLRKLNVVNVEVKDI